MEKQLETALGADSALSAQIVSDVAKELDAFIERLAAKTEIRLT